MSDATFLAKMAPYAMQAAHATGLDCRLFLVQWALESAWGTSTVSSHNNYAGLENSAGKGCTVCNGQYTCCPTVADFTALYLAILGDSTYASVRATAGEALTNQLEALGRSPWAASHYATGCGYDGCELVNLYADQKALFDTYCVAPPPNPCDPSPCPPGCTCVCAGPSCNAADCINCPGSTPAPAGYTPSTGPALFAVAAGAAVLGGVWYERRRSTGHAPGLHFPSLVRPSRS